MAHTTTLQERAYGVPGVAEWCLNALADRELFYAKFDGGISGRPGRNRTPDSDDTSTVAQRSRYLCRRKSTALLALLAPREVFYH